MTQNETVIEMLKLKKGNIKLTQQTYNSKTLSTIWWIPVFISSGEIYGVLGFNISYKYILDTIESLVTSDAESICLHKDRDIVYFSNEKENNCKTENSHLWHVSDNISLPGLDWNITLSVNPESFLVDVKKIGLIVFGIIFPIVSIFAFTFVFFYSNHILNAINQLLDATRIMGRGEQLTPIKTLRNDELGELAKQVNRSALVIETSRSKLEQKNRDLDAYSYTLAHDLRAPLRSISSFAQILEIDAGDKLADDDKDALSRIIKASKRMSALIDDILELSRLSNREIDIQNISLSHIAKTVIQQFQEADAVRNISFEINQDITVKGDPQLLRLVLENLLGNAWKYSRKNENTIIRFGSISKDNVTIYFISDNGIGFDMQYAGKLFKPFQRLHTTDEYEGTGIGLASVKRMIERHEGAIWIQSAENQGTTVYFTLWQVPNEAITESENLFSNLKNS